MSTITELKLLTLLNVSAVKKPRERDIPGGHRGSPAFSPAVSVSLDDVSQTNGSPSTSTDKGESVNGKKRRRSVVFGGEIGPSGSSFKQLKGAANTELNGKAKLNGKGKAANGAHGSNAVSASIASGTSNLEGLVVDNEAEDDDGPQASTSADLFNVHFGVSPPVLTSDSVNSAEKNEWQPENKALKGFGRVVELRPGKGKGVEQDVDSSTRITPAILSSLQAASELPPHFTTALSHLGSYRDFYLHSLDGEADGSEKSLVGDQKESMRKAAVVHSLNHVLKTRRKIIKNNERLAHATATNDTNATLPEPRDQSFTRPKVLFLLPIRSLALQYLQTHLFPLAPPGTQIENLRPFISSFSLPQDVEDPLSLPSASSTFPIDHLVNFRGNSDDNFRFGVKFTRKAWRVVMMPANEEKLLDCDILIASPLGLKMAAEREDSTDLLSSIEICVADGLDVMQMQNWDHVQFVFSHMNQIPKSPHGCDFSRVKPWYLDSQAQYLRQTMLLSRYDTPESRSLFHKHCHNLEGKIRSDKMNHQGVLENVKPGVKQVFERFDLENGRSLGGEAAIEEVDQRLEWFTKKTIPALLRSAISRQNTLIIVPSYFDYIRVVNYLRKADVVSYAAISEYSSNAEISRARTLFFKGKKAFLLVTERFHFYRRYRIRGAKTIVFYSLPDHAQFYSEFLRTPFLPSKNAQGETEAEIDEAEISSRVLFSRFDALRLERVVGSVDARRMLSSGEGRFEFI